MDIPLLMTKLYIPRARPEVVPRPRLIEQLNKGLYRKLSLVSAPAGFGKTTLTADWLCTAGRPFAWLSLDEDDNDLTRFLTYVIAALETVVPGVGADARALLQSPPLRSPKTILTVLVNGVVTSLSLDVSGRPLLRSQDGRDASSGFVLVLDDYHLIRQQSIHQAVSFLLEHQPTQMHLVIVCRSDPPLPLARLRARGQLNELRTADLRFTLEEATAFLNEAMGLTLPAADVEALEARTEGWIAGLQLAALSMRGTTAENRAEFVAAFSGSHRHVIDYLAEEVLAQQPKELYDFMCQTAILEHLTAPLCDAVTGRRDSGDILRELELANLFVVPLDDQREWYRYHRLFADFLRNHLHQNSPERVRDLHCWAAEWLEDNGLISEAIGHALKAAHYEWAARLIEQVALPILVHGEVTTLLSWLEMLPEELVRSHPRHSIFHAWALVVLGEMDGVETYLADAERVLQLDRTAGERDLLGQIAAARAYLAIYEGDVVRAGELARVAFEYLPQDDPFLHSVAVWLLGFTNLFGEKSGIGDKSLAHIAELGPMASNTLIAQLSIYMSSLLQVMRGRLREGRERLWQTLLLAEASSEEQPSPGVSLLYQGIGSILYEENNLEEAERYLGLSIDVGEQWGNAEPLVDSYVLLARIRQARGNVRGADEAMEKAERMVLEGKVSPLTGRQVEAYRARLWIAQGDPERATLWADLLEPVGDALEGWTKQITFFVREIEQSALVRMYIAERRFDKASRHLVPLLDEVEASGWMGLAIELLVLQSLLLQGQGRTVEALQSLQRALALAEPEGYVRVFVDAGPAVETLLQQMLARGIMPDYVSALLRACGGYEPEVVAMSVSGRRAALAKPAVEGVEALSEREQQVLQLIAVGLSNREIAGELVVAVSTVKTHINNIYRKLDVSSRTQAIARARMLGML